MDILPTAIGRIPAVKSRLSRQNNGGLVSIPPGDGDIG